MEVVADEDIDDFDIYADLDEDIDNNVLNSDNGFEYKDIEFKDIDICNINGNHVLDTRSSDDNNMSSNDLILSELTILEKSLNKTEDNNKCLLKRNEELMKELERKDKQIMVLKTNISSLYKTAKQEIERKKNEINGLREELDSLIFKRLPRNDSHCQRTVPMSDHLRDVAKSGAKQKAITCDKSINTSDKELRHSSNISSNNKKYTEIALKSKNESKSGQRSDRRIRSRSRDSNRHRTNGETSREPKTSSSASKRRNEDNRRRSDSKSRNDSKRHKYSDRK